MNQKWVPIVTRRISVLRTFLTARGSHDEVRRYLGVALGYLAITKNELTSVYLASKDTKRLSEVIIEKMTQNPLFPKTQFDDCQETCESFVQVSIECSRDMGTENLLEPFQRYCDAYIRFAKFMAIPVAVEKMLTHRISQALQDRVGTEGVAPYLAKLMTTPHLSESQLEPLALLRLAIQAKEHAIRSGLKAHADRFRWLSCYNIDEPAYSDEHFSGRVEELEKLSKQELQKQLQEIEARHEQDQTVYRTILDELKLDEAMVHEIELLREYVYLRTYRVEMQSKANFSIQPLFQKLSERFSLSLRLTIALTPEEMEKALLSVNDVPSANDLEDRCRHHAFRYDETGIVFVTGFEADGLERDELGIIENGVVNEMTGNAAYPGKPLRGTVQVVLTKEAMSQFQDNAILVTTMTTPEFVPIMKKAKAIITDEGGVLCHAAIIARELKKPCIIGTKIATQVLKDGDKVEVDANQGIVRILKRA
ncbi:MAG: PEP-utilizing enzyme [Candidatus Uhrbacteria bacterium]|nr:PEP-utilizing enzyme [Candidatus Uhrbacteria bacterium]